MELRYMGFDQLGASRAFRFEIPIKGASAREAVVTAEMGLDVLISGLDNGTGA